MSTAVQNATGYDHAGEFECSILMALYPDCVDLSRIDEKNTGSPRVRARQIGAGQKDDRTFAGLAGRSDPITNTAPKTQKADRRLRCVKISGNKHSDKDTKSGSPPALREKIRQQKNLRPSRRFFSENRAILSAARKYTPKGAPPAAREKIRKCYTFFQPSRKETVSPSLFR